MNSDIPFHPSGRSFPSERPHPTSPSTIPAKSERRRDEAPSLEELMQEVQEARAENNQSTKRESLSRLEVIDECLRGKNYFSHLSKLVDDSGRNLFDEYDTEPRDTSRFPEVQALIDQNYREGFERLYQEMNDIADDPFLRKIGVVVPAYLLEVPQEKRGWPDAQGRMRNLLHFIAFSAPTILTYFIDFRERTGLTNLSRELSIDELVNLRETISPWAHAGLDYDAAILGGKTLSQKELEALERPRQEMVKRMYPFFRKMTERFSDVLEGATSS